MKCVVFRVCWLFAQRVKPDARSHTMNFGLLLSNLPHVDDSRAQYEAMLSLQPRETHRLAAFWHSLKALIS
jgi:hypothetical protein